MKKTKISEKTLISTILQEVPDAAQLMMEKYGIYCIGCPMSQVETLQEGALAHGLSKKKLNSLLEEIKHLQSND